MMETNRRTNLQKSDRLYLDHNATTAPSPDVIAGLGPVLSQSWGNPSSIHWAGQIAKQILRQSREQIARGLGASPLEIVFTSGGSESNSLVFHSIESGFLSGKFGLRNQILVSRVEHPSVIKSAQRLQQAGIQVDWIDVDLNGQINLEKLSQQLSDRSILISVQLANNEFGSIFPIKEVARMAKRLGVLVHTDAVQGLGKLTVNLKDLDVDYASFSGHKFYALKGSGFLFVKKGSPLEPMILGGGQERRRRGGTENTLGIWAMGTMIKEVCDQEKLSTKAMSMAALREHLETRIMNEISGVQVTAAKSLRLPNTSNMVIDSVDGETLLMSLDLKGIAVSTGAACSSGNPEPSPALLAIGLTRDQAQSSLRVSLGWWTTKNEIDDFVDSLAAVVAHLRNLSRLDQDRSKRREAESNVN